MGWEMGTMNQLKARAEILGLVVALLIQLGMGIWWASDINRRVCSLEEWRVVGQQNAQRLTRIEADNDGQARDLSTIKIMLERIESKITDTQKAVWEHIAAQGKKS